MIELFIVPTLAVKAALARRFASEVSQRFAWRPWDRQWVLAWLLVNGQMLAAFVLWLLGVKRDLTGWLVQLVGVVAFVTGHALHLTAWIVNKDFRPEILLPRERCQHWLYRWLRHPGYIGLAWMSSGQTMIFGYWVLYPCTVVYAGLLIWRVFQEEKILCQRMQGN